MTGVDKTLLTGALVMTVLLVSWGIQTLWDSSPGLFARLCLGVVVVGMVALVLLLTAHFAHARDNGQWETSDPAVREWYRGLVFLSRQGFVFCFVQGTGI